MPRYWGKLIRLSEAIEKSLTEIREIKLNSIEASLWNALGMIVSKDITSPIDLPVNNVSAVDGYAVKSFDTIGASPTNPIRFYVKGVIETGEPGNKHGLLDSLEAVEVYTGAEIPPNSDAVIMYEDTIIHEDYIEIVKPVPKWANVTRKGDDLKKGDIIVKRNTILDQRYIAALAAVGFDKVSVYEKLKIGIIVLGDELVEPGKPLPPGKKYSFTEYFVYTYIIKEMPFAQPVYYGVVPDDLSIFSNLMEKALSDTHIVITIGGTSVSSRDIVPDYIDSYGRWIIRGIALRPGRTTGLAVVDNKPVFTLSGNIVAAWVGLEAFMKPLVYKWLHLQEKPKTSVKAVLVSRIVNPVGYRSFVRVKLYKENNTFQAEPYMIKGSSIVSSLFRTQGYIVVPEDIEGYEEGSIVDVHLF